MTPVDLLKSILNEKVIVPGLTENPLVTQVTIKEENPQSKTRDIVLNLPPDSVVFRLDMDDNTFSKKSPFLNESHNYLHSGCDYVVFCKHNNKFWFTLIELKSDNTKGASTQLCASSIFIRYLRELMYFFNCKEDLYELVYIVFSTAPGLRKTTTKQGIEYFKNSRVKCPTLKRFYYRMQPLNQFNLSLLLDCEPLTSSPPKYHLFNHQRCCLIQACS